MKLEIEKALVLSTGHVSKATAQLLPNGIPNVIAYSKGPYGWLIYTDPDMNQDSSGVPAELVRLLEVAQEHDCVWLMLDRDGTVEESLSTFDW